MYDDQSAISPRLRLAPHRRSIHYLGSKLRFASDIADVVDEVARGSGMVCDLFSGSGVVSAALGRRRAVVAVDIQEYARVVASALLRPATLADDDIDRLADCSFQTAGERSLREAWQPLVDAEHAAINAGRHGDPEPLAILLEGLPVVAAQIEGLKSVDRSLREPLRAVITALRSCGLDDSLDSVVSRYYGGLYFGVQQAVEIDVIRRRARELAGTEIADTIMSAVLSTASQVVGTVGQQFAQPLRPRTKDGHPKTGLWKRVAADRSVDVLSVFRQRLLDTLSHEPAREGSMAVRSDFAAFLESSEVPLSAVYADPPYTRDHYSRYYHVLETIALDDKPSLSRTNLNGGKSVSRGVYRTDRHQSPFSIVSQAPRAFETLFRLVSTKGLPLVLSYSPHLDEGRSRPRVMSIDRLGESAACFFRSVERIDVEGVAHSKLTRTDQHLEAPSTAEVLLVCRS